MAHIVVETVTVTISHIVKDGDTTSVSPVSTDLIQAIEMVATEYAGVGAVVEVAAVTP